MGVRKIMAQGKGFMAGLKGTKLRKPKPGQAPLKGAASKLDSKNSNSVTGKGTMLGRSVRAAGLKTMRTAKQNKGKLLAGGAVAGAAMVGGAVKKRQEDKKFKNRAKKFLGM